MPSDRGLFFNVVKASTNCSGTFVDEGRVKHALCALQRGPVRFQRNDVIACQGDSADYIFLVVGGVVRSCRTFINGDRNVIAFYLPGDLFGWSDQRYSLSVEAVTHAMVMFLKRDALISVAARESKVARFLLDKTTDELRRSQEHALLINKGAKCRVATFLTDLSNRLGVRGAIDLPMSRQDIADYLGLTIETLSRTITQLEQLGLIARNPQRALTIRNNDALIRLMG